jgi:hypothetical protein
MPRICCARGSAELPMVGGADEGAAAGGVEAGAAAGEGRVDGRIAAEGSGERTGDGTGDGAGGPASTDGGGLGATAALWLCVVAARRVAARVARTSAWTVP